MKIKNLFAQVEKLFFSRVNLFNPTSWKIRFLITTLSYIALINPVKAESLITKVEGMDVADGLAISVRGGTLGIGLELTKAITKRINAKLVVNDLSFSDDGDVDDIDYDFDIDLFSAGVLLDWHPFNGGFHLSGGLLYSENDLDAKASTNQEFEIGNTTYTSEEIGILRGEIEFSDFAPYLGIGWGNPVGKKRRWKILFDIGVIYLGSSDANLSSTDGTLSNNPIFQADLKREEESLQDDIDDYGLYPVLSLGISYKF